MDTGNEFSVGYCEGSATSLTPTGRVDIVVMERTIMSPVFLAPRSQYHAACVIQCRRQTEVFHVISFLTAHFGGLLPQHRHRGVAGEHG